MFSIEWFLLSIFKIDRHNESSGWDRTRGGSDLQSVFASIIYIIQEIKTKQEPNKNQKRNKMALWKTWFIIYSLMGLMIPFISSRPCFITNCPPGGKRSFFESSVDLPPRPVSIVHQAVSWIGVFANPISQVKLRTTI